MIHIKNPIINNNKVIYPIFVNNIDYSVFFEYPKNENIKAHSEGIVAVFYSIAKYNNIELKVDPKVNKSFKKSIMKINNKIAKFKNIKTKDKFITQTYSRINGLREKISANKMKLVVCPFTGGIDSLYSALKYKNEITHFFYIVGCDINYEKSNQKWIDFNINHIKFMIQKYFDNKPLIIIKSNLVINIHKILKEQHINTEWTYLCNGFGLFSSVINLDKFYKIIIPGPGSGNGKYLNLSRHIVYNSFKEKGSTSFLKIVQSDNTRPEKIKYIYKYNPKIFNHIRICTNWGHSKNMNCLVCNKCIRTALILNLLKIPNHNLLQLSISDIKKEIDKKEGNPIFYTQLEDLYNIYINKLV